MDRLIYLDHAATTPMRQEAVAAMLPFLSERFGNAGGNYRLGRDARRAVDDARERIAATLGCDAGEIVFTSGGTEGDNTVVSGALADGRVPLCGATEHHAVLDAVRRHGGRVVAVDRLGRLDLEALVAALAANACRRRGVGDGGQQRDRHHQRSGRNRRGRACQPDAIVHTDAVQAPGWVDLAALWAGVDALSLSAHKFGGPKGVGVLVIRRGTALDPLIVGGGQERGRRSGTHNVGGIVATAVALELTAAGTAEQVGRVGALRDRLVAELIAAEVGVTETVPGAYKAAGNAHVLVADVETGRCCSCSMTPACVRRPRQPVPAGRSNRHTCSLPSACPSRPPGAVRFTLGRTTEAADIDGAHGGRRGDQLAARQASPPRRTRRTVSAALRHGSACWWR